MTADEFKSARKALGMTTAEFGLALGYTGKNVSRMVRRLEDGEREISDELAQKAMALTPAQPDPASTPSR